MSKKEDRLNKVINIIKNRNGSSIKELASELSVSEMTIRRDIKILEENNVVEVYHGAVVYNPSLNNPTINKMDSDYDINLNSKLNNKEKDLIGLAASKLIKEDDIVIIDTGSTTDKLSKYIPNDLTCTCLVFSSNNFLNLMHKDNVDLTLAGGVFHRDTGMFESQASLNIIENTRANKVFLSAAGIHPKLGVTCANSYELATKKMIIKNSLEVILMADSSKFDSVKAVHFCEIDDVDIVITDKNISEKWLDYLKNKDIDVIIAD